MSHSMTNGRGVDRECQKVPLLSQTTGEADEESAAQDPADTKSEGDQQADHNGAVYSQVPCEARDFRKLFSYRTPQSRDELRRFRSSLFWLGLDQSTSGRIALSFLICFAAILVEPLFESFYVDCPNCDDAHSHPFQGLVEYSESALALISFLFLSYTLKKNGLRKVLLLDKIGGEPTEVQEGYEKKLHVNNSTVALFLFFTSPSPVQLFNQLFAVIVWPLLVETFVFCLLGNA